MAIDVVVAGIVDAVVAVGIVDAIVVAAGIVDVFVVIGIVVVGDPVQSTFHGQSHVDKSWLKKRLSSWLMRGH